jgi:hypothetical protein
MLGCFCGGGGCYLHSNSFVNYHIAQCNHIATLVVLSKKVYFSFHVAVKDKDEAQKTIHS